MNLRELRENTLGFRLQTVSQHTRIPLDRLESIETGDAPDIAEIESLATVYGVPSDILSENPIALAPENAVHLLTLRNEYQEWNEHIRYRIVQISNVARDLTDLRALATDQRTQEQVKAELPPLPQRRRQDQPWKQGRNLAQAFREYFGLGEDPVPSVRDLVLNFQSISLLHTNLSAYGPAGLTFANAQQGAVIVLNLEGKNSNPTARRVSLAHELCHFWLDWNQQEPLATVSGYLSEQQKEVEQRANAFAIRLLCPESVINRHLDQSKDGEKTAEFLIKEYGLPYNAAQAYLKHTCHVSIPDRPSPRLRSVGVAPYWEGREAPEGLSHFPLPEAPMERRTVVARYAAYLYGEGKIQRDYFAEALGVPPTKRLESVLEFFGIDPPDATL